MIRKNKICIRFLELIRHTKHYAFSFWQAAAQYERANGRVYTELLASLPRELTRDQRLALVRDVVHQQLGARHPYAFAIHNPLALDGGEQPHAHIMFSERTLDGRARSPQQFFARAHPDAPAEGGAAKERDWNRRAKVMEVRRDWASRER